MDTQLNNQFSDYMKQNHPKIIYSPFTHNSLEMSAFLAYPCGGFSGLFLELKKEDFKIHKRDGAFVNEHVKEQYAMIVRLNLLGYAAYFACGFEEAKRLTENYLLSHKDF